MEIQRVLCPVDFSEISEKALHHAAAVARWYGAELTVLHAIVPVIPTPLPVGASLPVMTAEETPAAAEGALRELIDRVNRGGTGAGVVRMVVRHGAAVGEIVDYAREQRIDLIVLGTHGLSGLEQLLIGSVAERVLHYAPCPVLTIPRTAPDTSPERPVRFRHIVSAVDFSPASTQALDLAFSLAKENDGELTLLHVLEMLAPKDAITVAHVRVGEYVAQRKRDACHELAARIPADARDWCTPSTQVEIGPAAPTILRIAEERHADLIVMGAQGHGAVGTLLLGSATQTVVRRATCPVLTARVQR
jgi:nucleotide-binding universal stress UspA family protein